MTFDCQRKAFAFAASRGLDSDAQDELELLLVEAKHDWKNKVKATKWRLEISA